jgi:hypothetical protein
MESNPIVQSLFPNIVPQMLKIPEIKDVNIQLNPPLNVLNDIEWRDRLPSDICNILSLTNGFTFSWSYGDSKPIGLMSLHGLSRFRVSSCDCGTCVGKMCIEIENVQGFGLVMLNEGEIWFKPSFGACFKIAANYTNYFRLMVSFLGIMGWQLSYSKLGCPQATQDWLQYFVPYRCAELRKDYAQKRYQGMEMLPLSNTDSLKIWSLL